MANKQMFCGDCLMERVDIVELNADGTCPVCEPAPLKEEELPERVNCEGETFSMAYRHILNRQKAEGTR